MDGWKLICIIIGNQTFSRSSRVPPNSFFSRSIFPNDEVYFGTVGGGMGRAAIAGLSWVLLILWMVAVCPDWNVDMYDPGVERIGFVGGIGGGPVGVVELIFMFDYRNLFLINFFRSLIFILRVLITRLISLFLNHI